MWYEDFSEAFEGPPAYGGLTSCFILVLTFMRAPWFCGSAPWSLEALDACYLCIASLSLFGSEDKVLLVLTETDTAVAALPCITNLSVLLLIA